MTTMTPGAVLAMRSDGELDLSKRPERLPVDRLPPDVQDWLAARLDRSPNTFDSYHRSVSCWLLWCLHNGVAPSTASIADAEAWFRWLKADRGPDGWQGAGLSPRSANVRVSACSSLYRRLLVERKAEFNPFGAIVSIRVGTDHLKTPALSEPQSSKVMKRALGDKEHLAHRAVIELLFTTAARASEIATANLGDLEPDEFGMALWVTRKGGKRQQLPVTPDALKAITAANAGRTDLDQRDAPLLRAPRGGRYSRHTISRLVSRYARGAGIDPLLAERVTAHTTRRTAITTLVDGGTDLRTAQTLAGHSDPRTTEGYIRARNDRRKHAAAAADLAARFHGE